MSDAGAEREGAKHLTLLPGTLKQIVDIRKRGTSDRITGKMSQGNSESWENRAWKNRVREFHLQTVTCAETKAACQGNFPSTRFHILNWPSKAQFSKYSRSRLM